MITMKNLLESKGGMGDIYGPRSSPPWPGRCERKFGRQCTDSVWTAVQYDN